jgi:DNA-directed RNA polymerase specialized sigma24 family protein
VSPQSSLTDFCEDGLRDLSELTEAEREVYVAVEREGVAVRELARETDRRPGTVGNLLKRARLRLADRDEEVSKTW